MKEYRAKYERYCLILYCLQKGGQGGQGGQGGHGSRSAGRGGRLAVEERGIILEHIMWTCELSHVQTRQTIADLAYLGCITVSNSKTYPHRRYVLTKKGMKVLGLLIAILDAIGIRVP